MVVRRQEKELLSEEGGENAATLKANGEEGCGREGD